MARWEREMIGSVPADALDQQARERVGDLLRSARETREPRLEAGVVVEFLRGGRLACGYLRSTPLMRKGLLIVDLEGNERRLRSDKLLHHGPERVAVKPLEQGVEQLQRVDRLRRTAADRIDLVTLRELAIESAGEGVTWTVNALVGIHESTQRPNSMQQVAMLRALFESTEFRRVGEKWMPRTPEALEGVTASRQREAQQKAERAREAAWLRRVAAGDETGTAPENAAEILNSLAFYVLASEPESTGSSKAAGSTNATADPRMAAAIALVGAAHLHGKVPVTELLVRLGYWEVDENLVLLREGIPQVFSDAALAQDRTLGQGRPVWRGWPNWGQATVGVADLRDPEICLRAWSVRPRRRGWRLRLHMALPTLWLRDAAGLVDEIRHRGIRLDLPDRSLPLLPPALLGACSFTSRHWRPALTLVMDLDPAGRLQRVKMRRTRLRLHRILCPHEPVSASARRLRGADELAGFLRNQRRASGAWEYLGGERSVASTHGQPTCSRDTVCDAGALDREFLLMGEQALGQLLAEADLPALHRARPKPAVLADDPIPATHEQSVALFHRWQMEGRCAAETIQLESQPHAGVGTAPRSLGLSPADSYGDLLMQRQMLALAGEGQALSEETLTDWLPTWQACREAAVAAQRAGRRHWCLRWLTDHQQERPIVWVAARRGAGYLVLFDELPMSAWVPAGGQMRSYPGDRLSVAIQRVSVAGDELLLSDPQPSP